MHDERIYALIQLITTQLIIKQTGLIMKYCGQKCHDMELYMMNA